MMVDINEKSGVENFRYRIRMVQDYFDGRWADSNYELNVFTPKWLIDSKNEYINIILDELSIQRNVSMDEEQTLKSLLDSKLHKYVKMGFNSPNVSWVSIYTLKNNDSDVDNYIMIYWWLVAIAIDINLNNNIDFIVDVADIFGFSEEMIDDWCEAVIYWLNGGDFSQSCNLPLKTKAGKSFFLHQY